MTSVIAATNSTDLARRLRLASDDQLTIIQPEQLPAGPAQLLAMSPTPESVTAVVVDVRSANGILQQALDLATRFEQQHPAVGVLLVGDDLPELALNALRAGVRDVLPHDADVADMRWALRRAAETGSGVERASRQDVYSGRVITVAAAKGGVGKTTVATNIARALAEQSPRGVVLVDLDIQFGDVAAALDLDPTYTLGDIFEGSGLVDPIALKTFLTPHPSGMQVACGVTSPVDAEKLTSEKVSRLLEMLRHEYRYVVVDTAPGMSEHTLAAFDYSTDLVLVTGMDVPGVRGLHKELEILDHLNLPPHTRHIVVNNVDRISGLSVTDVEATIGRKVDTVLHRTGAVLKSTNMGTPVVELAPRDRVSKELRHLASRFSPAVTAGERTLWRRGGA